MAATIGNRQSSVLFMKKISSLLTICSLLASTSAYSMTCISNPAHFDFMQTSAQVFYYGKEEAVRNVYEKLKEQIGDPNSHARTTLFLVKGDLQQVERAYCKAEKCTGMDVMKNLQQCAAPNGQGAGPTEICRPLAAVYKGKVYCMLAPGLDNYSSQKPFVNFNPYGDGGKW